MMFFNIYCFYLVNYCILCQHNVTVILFDKIKPPRQNKRGPLMFLISLSKNVSFYLLKKKTEVS